MQHYLRVFQFKVVILMVGFLLVSVTAEASPASASPTTPAQANKDGGNSDSEQEDQQELMELLSILEEETEVATKTKMNADYVPGIVTVLHGEDLEAMGARTVWEALGFVPGVEIKINDLGRPMIVFRGISGNRHIGHVQLLIDSVGANPSFRGINDSLMMIPIEQVERIEVIRGSGSSLYGEFALTGIINIITRKDGASLFGSVASFDTNGAGGLYSYTKEEKGFKVSINAAGWKSAGADVNSGIDGVETRLNQTGISFSPGPTNEDEEILSLVLKLDYKKTNLGFYGINRKSGAYFGNNVLRPESNGTTKEDEYWHLDAQHNIEISTNMKGVLKCNFSENEMENGEMLLPPGAIIMPPPGPGPPPTLFPDGDIKITYVKERRIQGGLDLSWTGWKRHRWFLGLSSAEVEIRDAWVESNVNNSTNPPTLYPDIRRLPSDEDVWIDAGQKRRILSAVLQDQYLLTEKVTLTLAARYDHFDDVGNEITPRLAAVWKMGGPHLLKFQYSEAYRPPTLAELYLPETGPGAHGNPNLAPEISKTNEVGYIFRQSQFVGRATIFYSEMDGLITLLPGLSPANHKLVNRDEVDLKGIEFEIEKQLGEKWKTMANLSFLNAKDKTNQEALKDSTDMIGNLIFQGRVAANLLAVFNFRHVGKRKRASTDTRDDLEGYDTVDLTVSSYRLRFKGLTFRASIKNIFDTEVKSPSGDYINDLPRPGRTLWTQISYKF